MRAIAIVIALTGCRFDFDAHADAGAPAAITYAQTIATWALDGTMATTIVLPNDVGAHSAIIVGMSTATAAVTLDSITDTSGNTYAIIIGPVVDAGSHAYVAFAMDVAPGPTAVTAFLSAPPSASLELFANEYTNVARTGALDDTNFGVGTNFGPDQMQSGQVTTHEPGELLYAYGLGPCVQAGTGFDMRTDYHGDVTEDVVVGVGLHQMTATSTCPSAGEHWQLLAASFRPALH